jgi:hypothetical protein
VKTGSGVAPATLSLGTRSAKSIASSNGVFMFTLLIVAAGVEIGLCRNFVGKEKGGVD